MKMVVSSWIPRSHLHLLEVKKSLDKLSLIISNISLEEELKCYIEGFRGYKKIKFSMNQNGLYSFVLESKKSLEEIRDDMFYLFLERIVKNSHKVTYKQIKRDILKPGITVTIISPKKEMPKESIKIDEFILKYEKDYSKSEINYISGPEKKAILLAEDINLLTLLSKSNYDMMDEMELEYHKADNIFNLLGSEIDPKSLKKVVFSLDLVKKRAGEIISKIEHGGQVIQRLINNFEKNKFYEKIELNKWSYQIKSDHNYVLNLWGLLLNFLKNIDFAAETRLTYQEMIESRRIQGLLSIDSAAVISSLFIGIFFSEFVGVGGIVLLFVFLITWMFLYRFFKTLKSKVSGKELKELGIVKKNN